MVPLFHGRERMHGGATAYVCENSICLNPTSDPAELKRLLQKM